MTAKTQTKSAAKSAKKATPVLAPVQAIPAVLPPQVHSLILTEHKAMIGELKAGQTVYGAFKALLLALPLNNAAVLNLAVADLRNVYGEGQKDAAQIRINLINNARKVEFGASKDGKVIKGRGRAALVSVLESCTSLRELKPALVEAKPEALKDTRGGTQAGSGRKAAKKAAPKAKVNTFEFPTETANVATIMEKLDGVLNFATSVFSAGKHAHILGKIKELQSELHTAEIAERVAAKKAA